MYPLSLRRVSRTPLLSTNKFSGPSGFSMLQLGARGAGNCRQRSQCPGASWWFWNARAGCGMKDPLKSGKTPEQKATHKPNYDHVHLENIHTSSYISRHMSIYQSHLCSILIDKHTHTYLYLYVMSADMRRYTYIYSTHTYIYNYIYIIV